MDCTCNLCQARKEKCDPLELYFGQNSVAGRLVRENPGRDIIEYERRAALIKEAMVRGICGVDNELWRL